MNIESYRQIPVSQLALQLAGRTDIDVPYLLQQVEGWQRLRTKVPSWAAIDALVYPHRLALEQCSGEAAARCKARIVQSLLTRYGLGASASMADLTGGLGVDFSFLAPLFQQATYVERQASLCEVAAHNFPLLGLQHARIVCADGVEVLQQMQPVDLLFLDPARRDGVGRKTVHLADCQPDVQQLHPLLLDKARLVVLKLSTMLDITEALQALPCVSEVHVISTDGECKDLLLVLSRDAAAAAAPPPTITAHEGARELTFSKPEELAAVPTYAAACQRYLYEPGPAVLKAGAFSTVAVRWGLAKLHRLSHLYTADKLVADFPGRSFEVIDVYGFSKAELRRLKANVPQANLTVRNFPASVDALRRKLKLREGGADYLFATTLTPDNHVLIHTRKP